MSESAAEKIHKINMTLESVRDKILGLNTSLKNYTLDENQNISDKKIKKLTDTLMFYILNEDPLLTKKEIAFIRYALLSMLFFASNKEALPDDSLTFKMALSAASLIDEEPDSYAELVGTAYFTMKPNFMIANLDGQEIPGGTQIEIEASKLTTVTEEQEAQIRKEWEKEHPNAYIADEILKNDQKVFEFYDDIPDQFYSLIELAFCAFLSDEGKNKMEYLNDIQERMSEV